MIKPFTSKKIAFGDNFSCPPASLCLSPLLAFAKKQWGRTKRGGLYRKVFYTFLYCKKGVTVMEMLVVLVIIGMLSLMAMPTFFAFTKNARLKGAARMISSSLRNARSYAITQRAIYTVDISLTDESFLMIETITAVKRIYASDTGIIDMRNYDGSITTGNGTFTFNPDGTATSTLTSNAIRVYDPASHYIEIKVYPTTGSVKTGDIDQDI